MSDTKKEWANMSLAEKIFKIFVQSSVLIIGSLLPIFMYLVPVANCGLNNLYPWCWAHPGTIGDAIGLFLYCFCIFWLSGLWSYLVEDDDEDPWRTVTNISWILGIIGVLLIILT